MVFQIIPAIDLIDGECVRLEQGDPARKKVYSREPAEIARLWVSQGAERIHIVDLDGAFKGSPQNLDVISRIRKAVDVELELGGGLRDEDSIDRVLRLGIDYAIVGSRACEDIEFLKRIVGRFGERIILGVDVRQGKLSTHGWKKTAEMSPVDFLNETSKTGIKEVIYTDISRDGMLVGANTQSLKEIAQRFYALRFIASGGIATLDHIRQLLSLNLPNLRGVIVGKALYENQFSLAGAITLVRSVETD